MDDNLLLNFTTKPNSQVSAKKLANLLGKKKGNWRDRVSKVTKETKEEVKSRHKPSTVSKPASRQIESKQPQTQQSAPQTPIVSSLFTYNPEIIHTVKPKTEISHESTNAPLQSSEFAVNPQLQKFLKEKMDFHAPTQIQKSAIPSISDLNCDIVLVAQTGSGKTMAYLLPIFSYLMSQPQRIDRTSGVFAVILAPTRELASQIFQVCEEICKCCHYIVPGLVIGGEKKKSEKARLRKGVNILIGTPGRMADHVDNTARLDFAKVKFVVLDEGDRLVDMGFEEQVTQILSQIPTKRKTILCSATMNNQASRLKTLALNEPVCWVREEQQENVPGQLVQKVVVCPAKLRLVCLTAKLNLVRRRSKRAVVFFSCTDSVDFHFTLFSKFQDGKSPIFKLHGSMTQQQRTETLNSFLKSDTGGVLLTTDVASRGLDATVDEVIEYDPPFTLEDHLHRVGRTARAGKKGDALLFLLPNEQAYESKIKQAHTNLSTETYQHILQSGFGFKEWMDNATAFQLKIEKAVVNNEFDLEDAAKNAFGSHVRAYTTHSNAEKSIFNLKEVHLGHLAKAFALRDAPKNIISSNTKPNPAKQKKMNPKQAMLEAAQRQMEVDEFHIY